MSAGCTKPQPDPEPSSVALVDPLPSVPLNPMMQAETAVAVVPPGANNACGAGAAVVTWAQDKAQRAMSVGLDCRGTTGCAFHGTSSDDSKLPAPTELVYLSEHPDADALCPVPGQPEHFVKCCEHDQTKPRPMYSFEGAADTVIVRLPNGDVGQLGVMERWKHRDFPDALGVCDATAERNGNALVFRISHDCGHTWDVLGEINSTDVSAPGSGLDFGGAAGGFDRPEMYYDPWSGTIWAAASATGVTADGKPYAVQVLFSSTDLGTTWVQASSLISGYTAHVMTSTPQGRLYVFQCTPSGQPQVFWTDDGGATLQNAMVSVASVDECALLGSTDQGKDPIRGNLRNLVTGPSVSLVQSSPLADILRGAYEHAELVTLPNGKLTDRQDLVVATFEVVKQGPAAGQVLLIATHPLSAANLRDSLLYPSFMNPDLLGGVGENDPLSDTSLLTWLETYQWMGTVTMRQRAAAVTGINAWSDPFDVAVRDGKLALWTPRMSCGPAYTGNPPEPSLDRAGNQKTECWSGDYHHGAFVDKQGDALRFLPIWPESDISACTPTCPAPNLEVHANLVRVREVAQ